MPSRSGQPPVHKRRACAPGADLLEIAAAHRLVRAAEDASSTGALGARIGQALAAEGAASCVATFALPPRFLPHGSRDQILGAHGLHASGITTTVLKRLARIGA